MTSEKKDLRTTIRQSLTATQNGTVTILSSLLAVEDLLGYVPPEAIEEVANFTSSTTNDVWGVASFYTNFRFTPPGDHVLEVCWGPSCHMLGAQKIVKEVLDTLDLEGEGDTADNAFTFKYNMPRGCWHIFKHFVQILQSVDSGAINSADYKVLQICIPSVDRAW